MMRYLIDRAFQIQAEQLVDSSLFSTRQYWRSLIGYPEFADDPRPLAECIAASDAKKPQT